MEQTLISDLRSETIQADISGQVSGQVAVGNYNLQIGSVHGGVVNINMVEAKPRLKPRQTPVRILPRSFDGLLDRVEVVDTASSVLPASQPVEFYGEAGAGKTSLLRYLSHHSLTAAFPDGVIYLLGRGQASADLMQSIFTALFEYEAPYKPSEGEIRHALQGKRALIVIDDVELEREDVEGLMDAAPQSTFLLTSSTRLLWGQYHSIAVPGLPPDEAGLLFERELGRSLTAAEVQPVAELCESLGGHPLYIVQAASLAREGLQSLPSLIAAVRTRSPKEALAGLALRTTTPQERRVVAAIAALDGAPLHARHLPALTGLNDADPVLERLQRRGLIQAHSPRFTLTAGPSAWVQEYWNLREWRLGLLEHFRTWLEGVQPEAELIAEESGPITRLVASAASLGYWKPALGLARSAEAGLAHSLRWEAWRSVLEAGLQAADVLGDLHAKALMLHQLGTRALCLNEIKSARGYLVRALSLRRMLGDHAGAAVTLHNLRLIIGPSGSNGNEPPDLPDIPGPPSNPWLPLAAVLKGATAALVAAVLVAWLALGANIIFPPQTPAPTMIAQAPAITASATPNSPTPTPELPTWTATLPAPTVTPAPTEPISTEEPTAEPEPGPPLVGEQDDVKKPDLCVPVQNWPVYVVQRGDTLWSIAQAAGTTVRGLKNANCLASDLIRVGQLLPVPKLPLADLVITGFVLGNPSPDYEKRMISVPYSLIITNRGKMAAEPFEVALYYQPGLEGGPASPLTLATKAALKPGKSVELQGQLDFRRPAESADLELWAVADECANRPGEGCKIAESNEQNNTSGIVEVRLEGDRPPTVQINEPNASILQGFSGNIEGGWYREVTLSGNAEDPEDGILEGSAITWRTDRSDLQDGVLGEGAHLEGIRLYVDRCSGTEHTLTMTATDSHGRQSSVSHKVTIQGKSCRPRLIVTSPESGIWPPSGYEEENQRFYLSLDGVVSATDVFGRPIDEARIIWTTDQVNIQKTTQWSGSRVSMELYVPYPSEGYAEVVHTITIQATDREGNRAQESFSITIYVYYEGEQ